MSKVTHRELEQLSSLLNRYGQSTEKPFFSYAVSRNVSLIGPFIAALAEARKPTKDEEKYAKAREKLLEENAKRDDKGNVLKHPVNLPGNRVGHRYELENESAFPSIEAKYIEENYPNMMEDTAKRDERLNELLDSCEEVVFHLIKMSDAPDKLISGNDMTLLIAKDVLDFDLERTVDATKE